MEPTVPVSSLDLITHSRKGIDMSISDWICKEKECSSLKLAGTLKCPHGKFFTSYGTKVLALEAEAAMKILGG
jgi:hypothetical protein